MHNSSAKGPSLAALPLAAILRELRLESRVALASARHSAMVSVTPEHCRCQTAQALPQRHSRTAAAPRAVRGRNQIAVAAPTTQLCVCVCVCVCEGVLCEGVLCERGCVV